MPTFTFEGLRQVIKDIGTPMAVALVGLLGSCTLQRTAQQSDNYRLYAELMGRREEAESAVRKDMFDKILNSFVADETVVIDKQVLNMELLAANFNESLDLRPLFYQMQRRVSVAPEPIRQEYLARLHAAAMEVRRQQLSLLEGVGEKWDLVVECTCVSMKRAMLLERVLPDS